MSDKNKFHFSEKTRRNFKYGSNSIILIIVVTVVAVLLNVVLEQFPIKFDFTTQKLFSITDQTKKVLNNLKDEVQITCLYDRTKGESDNRKMIIQILDHYDASDKVKVNYVDTLKDPGYLEKEVGKNDASDYAPGDYFVKSGNKVLRITSDDMYERTFDQLEIKNTGLKTERVFTSAILYVTADTIPNIYFSTGNLESAVDEPYLTFKKELGLMNFNVKSVNLTSDPLPDDATIIVFNSPKQDLSKIALEKLTTYFENGGNALFFIDPLNNGDKLENFNTLLSKFNIQINNDLVSEPENGYKNKPTYFQAFTKSKGSLESIKSFPTIILNSRSLGIAKTNSDFATSEALVQTSESAISTPILESNNTVKGIANVVVCGTYTGGMKNAKVLVAGSSQSITDEAITTYLEYSGMNIVNYTTDWMFKRVNQGDLIEIKQTQMKGLKPTTEIEGKVILVVCVFVIPFAILITGGVVWFRRRHL